MKIGIAGFGRMGAAMGARFAGQGHQLSVWNRSAGPAAAAEALGARLVETPAGLAEDCDVIISSLFDETAVRAVYLGAGGLASAQLNGRLVIETSTMAPALAPELRQAIEAAQGRFVDGPVLGSVAAARAGTLIALAGGTAADVAAAAPVQSLIARAVHALGPSGAGYAGKLAINVLKASYWAALGDCLSLARRYEIEPDSILDIIESGPGAIVDLHLKMPVLRGRVTEPAFDIIGCRKDLREIVAAGGGAEEMPVAAGALGAMERAIAGGWANRDVAAVALYAAARIASGEGSDGEVQDAGGTDSHALL